MSSDSEYGIGWLLIRVYIRVCSQLVEDIGQLTVNIVLNSGFFSYILSASFIKSLYVCDFNVFGSIFPKADIVSCLLCCCFRVGFSLCILHTITGLTQE